MRFDPSTFFMGTVFWTIAGGLAAFLALAWVLRGAPLGQAVEVEEDSAAPRAGYRDRITVAIVLGLLLIAAGGIAAASSGVQWALAFFIPGFGLVIALLAVNRRHRHSSPSLRRTIDLAGALLNCVLLGGLLVVVNVMAFRYGSGPLDLTREGAYSLSPLSVSQLKSLDRKLGLTLIFGQGARAARQRDRVAQLVESYRSANPAMVEVSSLDPYYDLTRIEELVKRAPELQLLHGGGVLVEYGEGEAARYVVVRNQDLFAAETGGRDRFESAFLGEDEITSALVRLRESSVAKVAFTVGHGEPALSDLNPGGRGLGNWRTRLIKVGCDVAEVNLIQDDLPKDLALLVIVGPKAPFRAQELAKLKTYAELGGPVLLALGNSEPTGLEEFLKSYNLEIRPGLVVEPRLNYNRNPYLIFVTLQTATAHPISQPLGENRAVLMPSAAPIKILGLTPENGKPSEPINRRLQPTPFLQTSRESWAESEPTNPRLSRDPKTDVGGPITVGVAVAERKSVEHPTAVDPDAKPRLVLFSSAQAAENLAQEIEKANLDLFMNAASWLRGRRDTIGISPRTHVALTLTADPALRSRLVTVPTVSALLLIIGLGITVYFARRA